MSTSEQSSLRSSSRLSGWREGRTRSKELYGEGRAGPGLEEMAMVLQQRVSHMKKIHGGGAANRTWPSLKLSYRCKAEECGAMFSTRPYLMRHIEVFHDGKEEGDVSMM